MVRAVAYDQVSSVAFGGTPSGAAALAAAAREVLVALLAPREGERVRNERDDVRSRRDGVVKTEKVKVRENATTTPNCKKKTHDPSSLSPNGKPDLV